MSELNKAISGADSANSVADDSNASNDTSGSNDAAAKHIDKLLKEKKNAMKGLSETKAELDELRAWKKSQEENELLKNQEFEKVISIQKNEIKTLKDDLNSFHTREKEGKKTMAFLSELKKIGFNDSEQNRDLVMKVYDRKEVEIDPTTNLVLGADVAAKTFYDKYNHLGLFGKQKIGVNQNAPMGAVGKLTMEEWKKLSPEDKIKRRGELESNYKQS